MDTMRQRFTSTVSSLLDEDPELVLVLAAIGVTQFRDTGVIDRHPRRVVNVGIREQLLIGFAAGMALEGFRPIVHSYAPFLVERPWEQIRLDFSYQGVSGILVSIGASLDGVGSGRTHQAPEDVALMATLPNWKIHVPGHPNEAEDLLRSAVEDSSGVYIRLSNESNAIGRTPGLDRFDVVRRGSSAAATIIAVGPMLDRVAAATSDLGVNLLYANTVRPFDGETLRAVLRAPEVVLVEPYLAGTSSAEVSAVLRDTPHRLLAIGSPRVEHRRYGTAEDHYAALRLDEIGIRGKVTEFLGRRPVSGRRGPRIHKPELSGD